MGKKSTWRLAIVLALITAAYLLVHAGFFAVQSPPPATPGQAPATAPAATPAGESLPPAAPGPQSGQMKMAEAPRSFTPSPPAATDYSYSLRKQNNERAILPGVTISPGQGVNIKTANKDENIQIKRDSTYPASDYQVMWQKKY